MIAHNERIDAVAKFQTEQVDADKSTQGCHVLALMVTLFMT